ncbi:MAG: hypothetical protein ACOCSJ_03670 [Candidatus Natronoplasma sp.]
MTKEVDIAEVHLIMMFGEIDYFEISDPMIIHQNLKEIKRFF